MNTILNIPINISTKKMKSRKKRTTMWYICLKERDQPITSGGIRFEERFALGLRESDGSRKTVLDTSIV